MQLILKLILESRDTETEEREVPSTEADEVSFMYYVDYCSCSKAAKFKSNKCFLPHQSQAKAQSQAWVAR